MFNPTNTQNMQQTSANNYAPNNVNTDQAIKKTKKKNDISFIILMGLVILLPLFFVPFSYFSFFFSKTILILLATILLSIFWIVARLKDGEFSFSVNPILVIGFLIPFVYLLSSLLSGSIMTSLVGQGYETNTFLFILVLFLLMFLTTTILKTKERVYYLFFSFFIAFCLISLFQLLRLFIGVDFLSFGVLNNSASNLIGKWNELSIFYGLGAILSLLSIEFVNQSKSIKIFSFVTFIVSLFFIALVNFSTVWIVLGIFAFILVAYVISSNKFIKNGPNALESNKFPIVSLITILLALVFVIGSANIGAGLNKFFQISSSEVRPSWQGTTDIVKGTLTGKQAILGAGPNKFVNQWLMYKPVGVNSTEFWNTDFKTGMSSIYSSLVTVGLVGFILWILFIVLLLYTGFKFIFIPKEERVDGYLLPLSFLSTVYLWLFSIIYVPSHVITALTFIFTGVLISLLIQNKVIKVRKVSFSNNQKADFILVVVLVFLVLILVVGGYIISQKFIASAYTQKGLVEFEEKGVDETEKNILKAINLTENDAYYRYMSEINMIKLQGLLSNKDISQEELKAQFQVILGDAIQNARKSTEIDKKNYQNWLTLGRVYESVILFDVQGAYDQALDSYIKAVNLNPKSPLLMFNLGSFEYNNKNYENAMPILENAVILKPDYSNAKYYLGLAYYNLGRTNDAILQFKDLIILNPENAELKTVLKNLEGGKDPFKGLETIQTQTTQTSEEEVDDSIKEE